MTIYVVANPGVIEEVYVFEHFQWWPFLIAITVLTLSPGVDTLLVIRNSARGGWWDGLLTSLGICSGLFLHAVVSAAGLSVILLGSAELFMLVKLAGALYLIWLGVQSLRSAWRARGMAILQAPHVAVSARRSLREGVLSNVLNPKPIVFYMAFLPQFIDPLFAPLPQALMMASVHFVLGMLWLSLLAFGVERARTWLARPRVGQVVDSISGTLLLLIGARMATQ